mmetsp:Transcript_8721/g.18685  ORF Transcript_8721/g.18685 Transcript_8721/m.18685 type:complete len:80 (-) Transcript_8721:141-380(-)
MTRSSLPTPLDTEYTETSDNVKSPTTPTTLLAARAQAIIILAMGTGLEIRDIMNNPRKMESKWVVKARGQTIVPSTMCQ